MYNFLRSVFLRKIKQKVAPFNKSNISFVKDNPVIDCIYK